MCSRDLGDGMTSEWPDQGKLRRQVLAEVCKHPGRRNADHLSFRLTHGNLAPIEAAVAELRARGLLLPGGRLFVPTEAGIEANQARGAPPMRAWAPAKPAPAAIEPDDGDDDESCTAQSGEEANRGAGAGGRSPVVVDDGAAERAEGVSGDQAEPPAPQRAQDGPAMSARPAAFKVADAHVRPKRARGPAGPQDGRWYWQARRGAHGPYIWNGWGTSEEALAAVTLALDGSDAAPAAPNPELAPRPAVAPAQEPQPPSASAPAPRRLDVDDLLDGIRRRLALLDAERQELTSAAGVIERIRSQV